MGQFPSMSELNPSVSGSGSTRKPESFEKNLESLDRIVGQLEDAELPLEKALELYEEGMRLTALCQQQLESAEGRVEVLRKRAGGKLVAERFQEEPESGGK